MSFFPEWVGRQPRVAMLVLAMLLVLAIYGWVWLPHVAERERLRSVVAEQAEVLSWMTRGAREDESLRAAPRVPMAARGVDSLLVLLDRSARESRLDVALSRAQKHGERAVAVAIDEASFDQLVVWLQRLRDRHGIRVASLSLVRQRQSGEVSGQMLLEDFPSAASPTQ